MRLLLVAGVAAAAVVTPTTGAAASCAADPHALSFHQMIQKGKTGTAMDTLILGKVVTIKDLKPGRGGDKIAKVAVADSPVGKAPLVARVRFWKPPPGVGAEDNFVYHRRGFYAILSHRLKDGTFIDDAGCGQTRRLHPDRFRNLVRFAREQH